MAKGMSHSLLCRTIFCGRNTVAHYMFTSACIPAKSLLHAMSVTKHLREAELFARIGGLTPARSLLLAESAAKAFPKVPKKDMSAHTAVRSPFHAGSVAGAFLVVVTCADTSACIPDRAISPAHIKSTVPNCTPGKAFNARHFSHLQHLLASTSASITTKLTCSRCRPRRPCVKHSS